MSREVPEGWIPIRLGALVEIERASFSINEINSFDTVRLYSLPAFDNGAVPDKAAGSEVLSNKYRVPTDCILFSKLNPRIPRVWRVKHEHHEPALGSTEFWPLTPRTGNVDLDFLTSFLISADFLNSPEITPASSTNSHQRVDRKAFENFEMLLPPLHEQRRIAEILSSVDEAVAATRAVIGQTRKVKQGVLERLLTKGIGHTRFNQTEIGEIPEGWEVAEVQEHFHVQLGKMLSKAAKVGSSPSPYLRNANVQWGRIDTEDLLYMDFSEQEKQKFRLQPGDLLVCEGGEVGRCAIWNDGREMYYQKALHRLRERTGVVRNQFLMYVLLRVFTSKALSAGLVGTNSIAHFTREQFLRLKFPVPDADEQNAICETLGALDVSINENISKTEALLSTKSALMSYLLTGRKRVTDALPLAAE